jgi:glucoamylase
MFKAGLLLLLMLVLLWFSPFAVPIDKRLSQVKLASFIPANHINVDNFNLQSKFKPFNIYPYRTITRAKFEDWILEQNEISLHKILLNIGDENWSPDLLEKNVSLGAVIASPSTEAPNYFYQWIRDGAITLNSVNHRLADTGFTNKSLQITVENYLKNSYHLQRLDNPSGKFNEEDLLSLGEPKFMVDGTPFLDNWGRPQNDGPALRVITIDNFLRNLEKNTGKFIQSEFNSFEDVYFKIMKLDLKYICKYWSNNNFDLWEEINSQHFFTSLTQLKALKIGLSYYKKYDKKDPVFGLTLEREFQNLMKFTLKDAGYINYNLNHIVETPSILSFRSGLDAAVIIASILTHDDDDDSAIPFDVNDGLVLNTLSEMVKTMKYLYPINYDRINLNLGVALGRYPEDVYNGVGISEGNPWFLTTLYASELLFKLINKLYADEKNLIIDESNRQFYFSHIIEVNNLLSTEPTDFSINIPFNSLAFNQTMKNVFDYADSFLDVVREHVSDDGFMSEQFNKYSGYNQGAENLTWSYGAYYSSFRGRQKALEFVEQ